MTSLADLPEIIGFFSYSREDDEDSQGALSALRDRIQRELRGQLGRSMKTFRLWQDKEAIAAGKLWEDEIKNAVGQAVFFIPIITPTVIKSPYCKFELESFLAREAELGRNDLVFPILYITVPELEDGASQKNDPVLSIIARRQYLDWREFRHRDVHSSDVLAVVERFCATIRDSLRRSWLSPEERKNHDEAAAIERAETERKRHEAESRRREEEARQAAAAAQAHEREAQAARERAEQDRLQSEAEAKRRAESEAQRPAPTHRAVVGVAVIDPFGGHRIIGCCGISRCTLSQVASADRNAISSARAGESPSSASSCANAGPACSGCGPAIACRWLDRRAHPGRHDRYCRQSRH